jgi:purine/pyrimidine-nucleoside phosphorylase
MPRQQRRRGRRRRGGKIASFRFRRHPARLDVPPAMTTQTIDAARVTTQANVYFDGKCVSHTVMLANGQRKSVGVILPAQLTFRTGEPETMECVAGRCEYRIAGSDEWRASGPGDTFSVPGNASFDIRVSDAYHYICHFG